MDDQYFINLILGCYLSSKKLPHKTTRLRRNETYPNSIKQSLDFRWASVQMTKIR
ncbi:hypothetical protein TanjilG_22531 [Lupinus angustifolius]|uniref:Uncharacterized protein n=1 Tax=Lupinus angustifolius TaxID=3871 RepID=A0A4P1RSN0_LUPAN|nr:hypothetical protein TanjilG_22531 [Lupinus angustifolius]